MVVCCSSEERRWAIDERRPDLLALQDLSKQPKSGRTVLGYFAHQSPDGRDPFDRLQAAGIHYLAAGENLALAPDVHAAHTGLMSSPGHRANILRPAFNRVGIGALRASPYGVMFTQEFTN